ncbi:hypothetical protein [Bacteroides sp. 51]|uniref:hypothetical protein n=1 Tax=Bacteroides sp. 51 TaxID=2302938 RepID=UPI0013D40853|nr:hypothetical protein [Bacteroides sp. 51]NDV81351.1 hypothetical protein [Bacteroides sp. 51]
MASEAVNKYITLRYDRWLEHSRYHCRLAGIPEEGLDVLNEVLCSLLAKDDRLLIRLLQAKKNGYTELDFFVLRMIKLNATSPTSPYRNRYKAIPADYNADYTRLEIEDIYDEPEDNTETLLTQFHLVREVFEELDLSPLARKVFEYRFFNDQNFSDWTGSESLKELYEVYNGVQELIRKKIKGESLF